MTLQLFDTRTFTINQYGYPCQMGSLQKLNVTGF
jgi:hypothetical protein